MDSNRKLDEIAIIRILFATDYAMSLILRAPKGADDV
jgi:hypothetical protein